jgi:hypothetical protein
MVLMLNGEIRVWMMMHVLLFLSQSQILQYLIYEVRLQQVNFTVLWIGFASAVQLPM